MQCTSFLLLLTLVACYHVSEAYKILVVFPSPGKSHVILSDGLVRNLANAGHEITYITPVIKKTGWPSNVRQIDVSDNFKAVPKELMKMKSVMEGSQKLDIQAMFSVMLDIHNRTYQNPNVQALLKDNSETFDVVLLEWLYSDVCSSFGAIYNAPYIWVSTVEPHWMALRLIDDALSPAYNSDLMSSNITPFSFFERVYELWLQIYGRLIYYFLVSGPEVELYKSLAPIFEARGQRMPDFEELKYNASLMLGNSHVSLGQPVSLPPSYKNIGGYHIDTNVPPLPKDLQKLLDNAKNGLIYFSMGTNLNSKDMPEELKASLLKMFATLKQTVLWKFEEVPPNLPSNVHVVSWAPQPSILSHPNCVLFITHGGLLSTTETVHFAKPIIGIPVFGDQFVNVNIAVKKGFAMRVDLSYTMADELKAAIEEITQNPKYSNKVKELSFVYHHRPTTPGAELVHWVEHVVKTGGAPHLRSPALNVPFYQKMYLDLLAFVLAVLFLIRTAFRRIFKKSSKKVKRN